MAQVLIPTDDMYRSPVVIPKIPPTPRARPIDSIQIEARDRFAGILWISRDPNLPVGDYFAEYDYFEAYAETKTYSKRPYQEVYAGVIRSYQNYLCIVDDGTSESHYVVAKRLPNPLDELVPYCNCTTCAASSFNPCKYIWCATCTRCLKAGPILADPAYIELAKTRQIEARHDAERTDPWSVLRRRLRTYKWIKIVEIVFCLVVLILIVHIL
jgi:hypothetical protein